MTDDGSQLQNGPCIVASKRIIPGGLNHLSEADRGQKLSSEMGELTATMEPHPRANTQALRGEVEADYRKVGKHLTQTGKMKKSGQPII